MKLARDDDFDAYIGLAAASTWWELGKRLTPLLDLEGKAKERHLIEWSDKIKNNLLDEKMTIEAQIVTPDAVGQFAENVLKLLRKKYHKEPIARDVLSLIKNRKLLINDMDSTSYLQFEEPDESFWAFEYLLLFEELQPPKDGIGWLNAVAICESCSVFFIKQRSDQRYHSDACRMRLANRKSYSARVEKRTHSKRHQIRSKEQ